ncbi:hypothetical protein HMN09_00372400 [Mycena chlorophos]|uniref:Uncharacterized protein n=1 Tax=Mycena chlorophos TaxID=658473 RepID=A0A8H6TH43_MYCCL|nr:hypothetical protein HMN09_00372400 [Mycena chlorophos]
MATDGAISSRTHLAILPSRHTVAPSRLRLVTGGASALPFRLASSSHPESPASPRLRLERRLCAEALLGWAALWLQRRSVASPVRLAPPSSIPLLTTGFFSLARFLRSIELRDDEDVRTGFSVVWSAGGAATCRPVASTGTQARSKNGDDDRGAWPSSSFLVLVVDDTLQLVRLIYLHLTPESGQEHRHHPLLAQRHPLPDRGFALRHPQPPIPARRQHARQRLLSTKRDALARTECCCGLTVAQRRAVRQGPLLVILHRAHRFVIVASAPCTPFASSLTTAAAFVMSAARHCWCAATVVVKPHTGVLHPRPNSGSFLHALPHFFRCDADARRALERRKPYHLPVIPSPDTGGSRIRVGINAEDFLCSSLHLRIFDMLTINFVSLALAVALALRANAAPVDGAPASAAVLDVPEPSAAESGTGDVFQTLTSITTEEATGRPVDGPVADNIEPCVIA